MKEQPWKAALSELWQSTTSVIGAGVLITGSIAAFIYCWLTVSDWLACEGKWARCTKCGGRTKSDVKGRNT